MEIWTLNFLQFLTFCLATIFEACVTLSETLWKMYNQTKSGNLPTLDRKKALLIEMWKETTG